MTWFFEECNGLSSKIVELDGNKQTCCIPFSETELQRYNALLMLYLYSVVGYLVYLCYRKCCRR